MAKNRTLVAGVLVLGSTAAAAGFPTQVPAHGETLQAAEEYVVAFDGGPRAARRAVRASGGTVVDLNEQLGVALVRAVDDGFGSALRSHGGVEGIARNHAVGLSRLGMPHRYAEERPSAADRSLATARTAAAAPTTTGTSGEPLGPLQWDMAMIGAHESGAHRHATGAGVDVGIIDTGIDATHPDIAPNFDGVRSRNFTTDIPSLDGPCETLTCVDAAWTDDRGHGTHVAGTVAAARNGFGIAGVAPEARLVNLRAGQDSGYFFLYETINAIVAAGDLALDVVNLSFYTDPWMYNCDSPDDYLSGTVTEDELAQQRLTRRLVGSALEYAHSRGVTLVAAAGNEHANLSAAQRFDPLSPGFPPGSSTGRLLTRDCLDLPSEGPHVIAVGAVGPSGMKADYSNFGLGSIDLTAPGGWIRDQVGTPDYQQPGNLILSTYPTGPAMAQGLADGAGNPVDGFSLRQCTMLAACGFYTYLQGTSMAAPHVVGAAALVVQRHGTGSALAGYSLAPDQVGAILARTASDRACPVGGTMLYAREGRADDWNAVCDGNTGANGLYGEGIVDAAAAVR